MGVFVKGDVIVLPFPFTDLSSTKLRPAFVLAAPKTDELIVCQITTQPSRMEYVIPIKNSDFASGGLRYESFVRPNHVFTAEPRIVTSVEGKLKPEKIQEILDATIRILREK